MRKTENVGLNWKAFGVRAGIALSFGPLLVLLAWLGGLYWFALITALVILSLYEYLGLAQKKQANGQLGFGVLASLSFLISLYLYGEHGLVPVLMIFVIIFLFGELYRERGSRILNSAVSVFAFLFFPLFLGSFILIREMPRFYGLDTQPAGGWIIMVLLSTWICDTAAYMVGSYIGKHKLIARISPNKSIEGTIAGFCFSVLVAWICHITFIEGLELVDSLLIGAIVGSIGQYGDLFESMLKRDAGVKDSSNLIPGHGGILDRFDSLILSAPVVYLYLRTIVFGF